MSPGLIHVVLKPLALPLDLILGLGQLVSTGLFGFGDVVGLFRCQVGAGAVGRGKL